MHPALIVLIVSLALIWTAAALGAHGKSLETVAARLIGDSNTYQDGVSSGILLTGRRLEARAFTYSQIGVYIGAPAILGLLASLVIAIFA